MPASFVLLEGEQTNDGSKKGFVFKTIWGGEGKKRKVVEKQVHLLCGMPLLEEKWYLYSKFELILDSLRKR